MRSHVKKKMKTDMGSGMIQGFGFRGTMETCLGLEFNRGQDRFGKQNGKLKGKLPDSPALGPEP